MHLRNGDWAPLQFNVQMQIYEKLSDEDDHDHHIEMSCDHDMVDLHRIMTNVDLPVFFDASPSHQVLAMRAHSHMCILLIQNLMTKLGYPLLKCCTYSTVHLNSKHYIM